MLTQFLTALALAANLSAPQPSEADRRALVDLATATDVHWDAKDAPAMASLFTDDATLKVGADSPVVEGRRALEAFYARGFQARSRVERHITALTRIEMITPTVAFTDARVRIDQQQADGSWTTVRSFANTAVAVKADGRWRLRSARAQRVPLTP
jgi:uncharacterized protein (TIGR02246 family)